MKVKNVNLTKAILTELGSWFVFTFSTRILETARRLRKTTKGITFDVRPLSSQFSKWLLIAAKSDLRKEVV